MKALAIVAALFVGAQTSDWTSEVLDVHNIMRRECKQSDLVYDSNLAKQAAKYAAKCVWAHSAQSERPGSGENLAMGSHGGYTAGQLAQGWADEKPLYNEAVGFSSGSGHYTQMVWKDTKRVGCALNTKCSFGDFLVCQYQPQGNYMGQFTKQACVDNNGTPRFKEALKIKSKSKITPGVTTETKNNPDGSVTTITTTTRADGSKSIQTSTRSGNNRSGSSSSNNNNGGRFFGWFHDHK